MALVAFIASAAKTEESIFLKGAISVVINWFIV